MQSQAAWSEREAFHEFQIALDKLTLAAYTDSIPLGSDCYHPSGVEIFIFYIYTIMAARQKRHDMLDDLDERLDQLGDATDDAGDWIAQQRQKTKAAYHDAAADNADDARDAFDHRVKATQAKAKAKGYELE